MEEDFYEEEENIEEECSEVEEACEVNEIPIDEIIDTGTVYLEDDSTLEAVEPYFDKFNEIEDQKEDLIEVLEEGIAENEDEIQKELDILDYKQDYYTNLTPFDDTSDDEEINLLLLKKASDSGGGADSDMVMESNVQVIEEDDEVDVEEDDNPSVYREDKLRTDERQKQMEEENSEEEKSEDDFLSAFVPYDLRSRSDGR